MFLKKFKGIEEDLYFLCNIVKVRFALNFFFVVFFLILLYKFNLSLKGKKIKKKLTQFFIINKC